MTKPEPWSEGPWGVSSPEDDIRNSHQIIASNGGLVATVPMVSILHKADAALIAQAPTLKAQNAELLAGLEAFAEMLREEQRTMHPSHPHGGGAYPTIEGRFNALFQPILNRAREASDA